MQNNNTISIVALICGILGVLALFFSSMPLITWLLFLAAIAGVVLGAIGMTQSKGALGKASGMAIAGLIHSRRLLWFYRCSLCKLRMHCSRSYGLHESRLC